MSLRATRRPGARFLAALALLAGAAAGLGPAAPPTSAAPAAPGAPAARVAAARTGLPPTELMPGDGPGYTVKDQSVLEISPYGYRYISGQQDNRLTIREVGGRLRYLDRGTRSWKFALPRTCRQLHPRRGIGADCRVPGRFRDGMFLEVWPRLGNDRIDGHTLPARYRMWVLADAGRDVVRTGAGDDFVNGAQDRDVVHLGPGDDWARGGKGDNALFGQGGDDQLVGQEYRDRLYGGRGDDKLFGSDNDDVLRPGPGADKADGGNGRDTVFSDLEDVVRNCELLR